MKPSEFQNFQFSRKLWWKSVEHYRNCSVAEKRIVSKLTEILMPNFDSINWTLEWRLCTNFTSLPFILSEKKIVKEHYYLVGPVHLNDSVSPKMVIKICFNIFRFFKKYLGQFECRRCNTYMTANSYFVPFTDS